MARNAPEIDRGSQHMQRRRFLADLSRLAVGTVTVGAAGLRRATADQPPTRKAEQRLLDAFREDVFRWSESLWDEAAGGYRQNDKVGANLMSSTDFAWIRYAVNEPNLFAGHREKWVGYLQQFQDARTGNVAYNAPPGGHTHNDGHALWHTTRALRILGSELPRFPDVLRPVMTVPGLRAWFDARDWEGTAHHHEVLGLVPLLANQNNADWTAALYEKIREQQNPATGGWPKKQTNISRTFAYSALHQATGRLPPQPEKVVDLMLAMQGDSALWGEQATFNTMDAAWVLVRLPAKIAHRQAEARDALARLGRAMRQYVATQFVAVCAEGTHRMLSIAHTLGLLQEAFPEEFPSERPYRFGWDDPRMYYCAAIRKETGMALERS